MLILSSESCYHKYLLNQLVWWKPTQTKLTSTCAFCHPHLTHNATSAAQLWAEQHCHGITEYSRRTRVLVNVWSHRLGLVTTLQSRLQIGCHFHLLSRLCLSTVEATVTIVKLKAGVEHVVRSHPRTRWSSHWLINTRESMVRNCPSDSMRLQIKSLGCAAVNLITIPACVRVDRAK